MGAVSSRIGLVRLVMGAAFMLLGFFLASTTQARADDAGLLGVTGVTDAVHQVGATTAAVVDASPVSQPTTEPVAKVVSSTAADVESAVVESTTTVEAPVRTVESVVTKPVKAVTAVVAEPVAVVATTTSAVISATTSAVKPATEAVVRAVEPILAPVTDTVLAPVLPVLDPVEGLDPALSVVEPVLAVVPSTPAVDAPGVDEEAIVADVLGAPVDSDTGQSVVVAVSESALAVDRVGGATATQVASPAALPTAGVVRAASVVERTGAHGPSDTPAPGPAQLSPGALPGSGTSGSGGSGAPESATTPSTLTLPTSSSAALTSHTSLPCPGPALDPGSRPD